MAKIILILSETYSEEIDTAQDPKDQNHKKNRSVPRAKNLKEKCKKSVKKLS